MLRMFVKEHSIKKVSQNQLKKAYVDYTDY